MLSESPDSTAVSAELIALLDASVLEKITGARFVNVMRAGKTRVGVAGSVTGVGNGIGEIVAAETAEAIELAVVVVVVVVVVAGGV